MALDLMLSSLIISPEFLALEEKNWEAISRLIPGTTPYQCARRFQEVQREADQQCPATPLLTSYATSAKKVEGKSSRPQSAKDKVRKETPESDQTQTRLDAGDQGPVMVIHVCDEAKNLKQDFQCPRDLLIREMKYFAEYLLTDAQRWEEVDISVHCDVHIFDWLMKYAKRGSRETGGAGPKLEPSNVISILISSDFLKMDALVKECIGYCHRNMSAIVATPCNMNCINEKLVTRIADMFSHNEADDVRDKKDKFKSKIFQKKLERLFEADFSSAESPENAHTLYRCEMCQRLVTRTTEKKLPCVASRLTIGRHGEVVYQHSADPTWDINSFLLSLKASLHSWRDVYWRVWGAVNYLYCHRCHECFSGGDLDQCKYHPEEAEFEKVLMNQAPQAVGAYPCCQTQALRFDPTALNTGCQVRDHVVSVPEQSHDSGDQSDGDLRNAGRLSILSDLLAHRESVCPGVEKLTVNNGSDLDVFAHEEQACGLRPPPPGSQRGGRTVLSQPGSSVAAPPPQPPKFQSLTERREVEAEEDDDDFNDDDEIGDDEVPKTSTVRRRKARHRHVTIDPQAILVDGPSFNQETGTKWDTTRSLRFNQDTQRLEDFRRMNEIVQYLAKLRHATDKGDKNRPKEYAGGMFARLEAQWRAAHTKQDKPTAHVPPMREGRHFGSKTKLAPTR